MTAPTVYDAVLSEPDRLFVLGLVETANWQRSTVTGDGGRGRVDQVRTSETLYWNQMPPALTGWLHDFETFLAQVAGRPANRLEGWQAVRYNPGQSFESHYDPGGNPANERELTVILTLQAPDSGGHTWFPRLGLSIESRTGRLIIWNNLLAGSAPGQALIDPDAEHAGMPVNGGQKIILVNWFKQR